MPERPRDAAYRLLGGEAWREDRVQIVRDCQLQLLHRGELESLDRAFMAGVEIALADAKTATREAQRQRQRKSRAARRI